MPPTIFKINHIHWPRFAHTRYSQEDIEYTSTIAVILSAAKIPRIPRLLCAPFIAASRDEWGSPDLRLALNQESPP